MIGGLVMTHGDDNGLRVPPLLAPIEIVIVPIWKTDEDKGRVKAAAHLVKESLLAWERRTPGRLRVHVDDREGIKPGAKYYEWELRGVPVRIELGPRDLDQNQAIMVRRDTREKRAVTLASIGEDAADLLHQIQETMLIDARERREQNSIRGGITYDRFREVMAGDGAFVYAGWCGDAKCEAAIKEETKATIRVLPDEEFRSAEPPKTCLKCGQPSTVEALWAKAY
jgi:prolyl-tRNA synthetase